MGRRIRELHSISVKVRIQIHWNCLRLQQMDKMGLSLTLIFLLSVLTCASGDDNRPNIIYIIADDLGSNDFGFLGSDIFTPNLNKLADESIFLPNFYTQPSCTPSRSALMTGRHPASINIILKIYTIILIICDLKCTNSIGR